MRFMALSTPESPEAEGIAGPSDHSARGMDRRLRGVVWQCLFAVSLHVHQTAAAAALGRSQDGFVTFFSNAPAGGPEAADTLAPSPMPGGGLISGACGYELLMPQDWPYDQVVALGLNNSIANAIGANKLGCGECIRATCTSSNCAADTAQGVTLWVTDGCGGCAANQLNVPAATFLRHFGSSLGLGRVNVSFQQVECTPPGDIKVRVVAVQPDSGGYIALAFLSVAGSGMLGGVDIKTSGSQTWAPMTNGYGNVWQASNIGAAPLDIRLKNVQGQTVIAVGVIRELERATFQSSVQFSPIAPAPAPRTTLRRPPGTVLPTYAPRPTPTQLASAPTTVVLGSRVTVPLYFDPPNISDLGAYAGIIWSYVECFEGTPVLNLTVSRQRVPTADGNSVSAFALHTFQYASFKSQASSPLYEIMDYSFFNLETGEMAQLYEPQYASFSNTRFNGKVPVQNLDTSETVFPTYLTSADLSGPAGFDYTVLLPPGPNENPTPAYLKALEVLFYFLTTLTLGNPGASERYLTCSPGYAQLGPWADYVRSILSQLAPSEDIVNDLYSNIPLGQNFAFQGTSFTIDNAIIQGRLINTTMELSSSDCGTRCRRTTIRPNGTGLCSAWMWCGSISGCSGGVKFQTCQLKNASTASRTILPDGFLNIQRNGSIRFTSGSLILPPPTGINLSDTTQNYSSIGAPVSYGLMTSSASAPTSVNRG